MVQRTRGGRGLVGRGFRVGGFAAGLALLLLAGCGGDDSAARKQQADEIAKGIEGYLALFEDPKQPMGLHHDKVTVTPDTADKGFTVAVTGLKIGDTTEFGVNLGDIDYRLTPADAGTYQVSDLKVANEIPITGKDGKPEAAVKFETTAFSGVWSTSLQNFLSFDWQAKNLSARVAEGPADLARIETVEIKTDGKDAGKGLIDQTTVLTATGISTEDPKGGSKLKLAKLTDNLVIEGFDLSGYMKEMEKLRGAMEKLAAQAEAPAPTGGTNANPPAPAPLSEEDRKVFVGALTEALQTLPKMISGYSSELSAEGLTYIERDGSVPVHLGLVGTSFAFRGINTDKAELAYSIKHEGLDLTGPEFNDPLVKAVLPKSGNLSLAVTEVPVPALIDALIQSIPEMTSADPSVAEGGRFALMGGLMSALSKSTIKLRIDPSALNGEIAHLSADGQLKLAMQSPVKAVGVINLALIGLDEVIALAGASAPSNPNAQGAMPMLQMVQAMAKRETGSDGKPVDKFKIDLTETGEMLINGKPFGAP